MTKFVLALLQLIKVIFPGTHIYGCYIHFAKHLWIKVEQYKEDALVRQFIQNSVYIHKELIVYIS